jgi:hypothetical protein
MARAYRRADQRNNDAEIGLSLQPVEPGRLDGEPVRSAVMSPSPRGTEGSNPLPSSRESCARLWFSNLRVLVARGAKNMIQLSMIDCHYCWGNFAAHPS